MCFGLLAVMPMLAQQSKPDEAPPPQSPSSAATPPIIQAPPPPPPPPLSPVASYYTGNGASITLYYWLTPESNMAPIMQTGHSNTNTEPSNLDYPGKPKDTPALVVSFPLVKNNTLRISYFRTQGEGNVTSLGSPQTIYGTAFLLGDYLAASYTIQNVKASLDYLSWPFPVRDSRFRFKTLWEVQATGIGSLIYAPYRTGELDAAGNAVQTAAIGSKWFVFPTFGVGADYLVSKNFRFEARASGFAFPHSSTLWDAEATANFRVGRFEVFGGDKFFHFKTSPKGTEFLRDTLSGVFVGVRWYIDTSKL